MSACPLFGLVIANVMLVVPFSGMVVAPNDFVMLGGVATVSPAVAVLPVPPLVEVTLPVVLVYEPDAAPVTVTLNWHGVPAATLAPLNAIPVGAVVTKVPPHTADVELATVRPVGSVSANATPSSEVVFPVGLVMVKFSEVVAFNAIADGLNTFAIDGGATTKMLALPVLPVPPSVEVTAEVVLLAVPAATPVTFTENVHVPPEASDPAERLIALPAAEMVPLPQLPVKPFGVDTVRLLGRVSVKATPVSPTVVFGFVTVKLRLVVPFSGMLAAPNALLRAGGPTTVMLAFEVLPVPPSVEFTVTELFFTPTVVP